MTDAQMYERIKALMEDANSTDANTKVEAIHGLIRDARKISRFAIEQYETRQKLGAVIESVYPLISMLEDSYGFPSPVHDAIKSWRRLDESRSAPTAATPDMGQEG